MKWTIDPVHSSVEFAVRHMSISLVRGRFNRMSGTIETADDGRLAGVDASIDASSIDTAESRRDVHLLSPDFLDAANYPTLTFRSTAIDALGDGRFRVKGDFTIRGETHPAVFEVVTASPVIDLWGNRRSGAHAVGAIARKDWGLAWNQAMESGGVLVGDEVQFTLDIEAVLPESTHAT